MKKISTWIKYLIISLSLGSIVAITIFRFNIEQFIIIIGEKNVLEVPSNKSSVPEETVQNELAMSNSDKKDTTQKESISPVSKEISVKDKNTYTGYLKNMNDKDIHEFTLNYPSAVNVFFYPSGHDDASYRLTLRYSSGAVLTQKIIEGENLHANTGNLYLRAGTYKIEIGRLYSWSGKPFNITLNISQAVNTEEESNDTIQTANFIPLNEDIRASTGIRNDIDCFAFTLDKTSSICPHLEFKPVRNGRDIYDRKLYELVIYGIDKDPFTFRGDNKPSKTIRPFILEAGTYVIKLSRIEDEKLELGLHEYTLRISAQEIM